MESIIAMIGAELRDLNETMREIAEHLGNIEDYIAPQIESAPDSAATPSKGNETR